jgi:hypothetical protein
MMPTNAVIHLLPSFHNIKSLSLIFQARLKSRTNVHFAAPSTASFGGISPKGCGRMPHVGKGIGTFLLPTPDKTEKRRKDAVKGRVFFGYFLFDCMDAGARATHGTVAEAMQKKVSRLRAREPDKKNRRSSNSK